MVEQQILPLRLQANLDHLPTRVRVRYYIQNVLSGSKLLTLSRNLKLVVELADVRIIALGVLNKPRGPTSVNTNARLFLHPPGIENEMPEIPPPASVTPSDPIAGGGDERDGHASIVIGECYCMPPERTVKELKH